MSLRSAFSTGFRLLKWLLILSALTAFAAVASLYFFVSPKRVADQLGEFSHQNFAADMHLSGDVTIRHLPKIEITLPAGTFTDTADGSDIGRFSSGTITVSPWGLLIGQLHISRLSFDGFETAVEIPDAAKIKELSETPLLSEDDHWIEPVVVRRFALTNASVRVDGLRSEPVQVKILSLETGELAPRMTSFLTFRAEAESPADSIRTALSGDGRIDLDLRSRIAGLPDFVLSASGRENDVPFKAELRTDRFQYVNGSVSAISVAGTFASEGALPSSAEITLSDLSTRNAELSGKLTQVSFRKALEGGTQSFKAAADIGFAPETKKLTLSSLSADYTLAADNAPEIAASLKGNLSSDIAAKTFEADTEGTLNEAPLRLEASGSLEPEPLLKASVSADRVNFCRKDETLPAIFQWKNFPSEVAAPLRTLADGITAEIAFSVRALDCEAVSVTDLTGRAAVSGKELSFSDMAAGALGGRVSGSAVFRDDGSWSVKSILSGVSFEKAAGGTLSGKLDAETELSAATSDPKQLISEASGHASFSLKDGLMPGLGTAEPVPFESVSGRAVIRDGIATAENFRIAGRAFRASGSAELDLQTLSIAGEASVSDIENTSVQAILDGTLARPAWNLPEPLVFEEKKAESPAAEASQANIPQAASLLSEPASSPAVSAQASEKKEGGIASGARAWFNEAKEKLFSVLHF